MKKLNGRLVVSALLAAAMISMTAVSAGAVDYSDEGAPTTVTPEDASVLTDSDVSDALSAAAESGATEVTVEMEEDSRGNVTVQESAIAEIASGDVAVTVEVTSDSGTDYSITIDPALVTEAKAINLAMDITTDADEGTTVSGVEVPAGSIVIAPAQKGDFGMTLQVNLPAGSVGDIDTSEARLYYISDDGDVEKMPKKALKFNRDGSVTVSISHASEYVISDVDLTLNSSSAVDADIDDNSSYGKTDDDVTLITGGGEFDGNPGTGVTLALGALAASAAAVVITAKKRK